MDFKKGGLEKVGRNTEFCGKTISKGRVKTRILRELKRSLTPARGWERETHTQAELLGDKD